MSAINEILKGPITEALKTQLADEVRSIKLYEAQDAAHLLTLPIDRFRELAKGIPSICFGEGRKRRYSLKDLLALVEKHRLPPIG